MTRHPPVFGGTAIPTWFTGQENDVRVVSIVDESGSLVTIPWVHYRVHMGLMFQADGYNAALGNAATLILGSPDPIGVEAHFTLSAQCGGDATVELIEGATPTGGAVKVARNMNRNYADGMNVTVDPALAGGTVISGPILIPGGSGPQSSGGSLGTRLELEWETLDDEAYHVRLTNISGQVQPASIVVNFYAL